MAIKSKSNGLIIGSSESTNEVIKLGNGKFAKHFFPTRSENKGKTNGGDGFDVASAVENLETLDLTGLSAANLRAIGTELELGFAGNASKVSMVDGIERYLGSHDAEEEEGEEEDAGEIEQL